MVGLLRVSSVKSCGSGPPLPRTLGSAYYQVKLEAGRNFENGHKLNAEIASANSLFFR